MSADQVAHPVDPTHRAATGPDADASTGELVARLSQDVSQLVRDELTLAQREVAGKAKQAGIGIGMFSVAGVLALFAVAVLIATVVLALDLVLPAWLAALVVGLVLLVAAGIAALLGKKRVTAAAPPVPQQAVDGLKRDVATLRHGHDL